MQRGRFRLRYDPCATYRRLCGRVEMGVFLPGHLNGRDYRCSDSR